MTGAGLAVTLLMGLFPMDVHGMLAFVGMQSVWCLVAGWLMWQGRI